MQYDKIILGAGLYGLYAALICSRAGQKVAVLEYDDEPFMRATYINQARVHMGYHYPRSYSTAIKSATYFERFLADYRDCILTQFQQVYAISSEFSWTDAKQFKEFCRRAEIPCEEIPPSRFFREGMCDGAFLTREYTYDAKLIRDKLMRELTESPHVEFVFHARIAEWGEDDRKFYLTLERGGERYESDFLVNATYASVNQINQRWGQEPFAIKYELCEIILCQAESAWKDIGLTVMDGPFFSIMPFGKTGYHSLTSVSFTPHMTSYEALPVFPCQKRCAAGYCSPQQLGNCNDCTARPGSAWIYMSRLARKYMKKDLDFSYVKSLYSMKPILKAAELDDSRPTVIRQRLQKPNYLSVLSGKINTVYDLDEVLLQ